MPVVGGVVVGAETENENVWLAVLLPASVTCAANENGPVCVVVPPS